MAPRRRKSRACACARGRRRDCYLRQAPGHAVNPPRLRQRPFVCIRQDLPPRAVVPYSISGGRASSALSKSIAIRSLTLL